MKKVDMLRALEVTIASMPDETPQDRAVKLGYIKEYNKVSGFHVPDVVTTTTNNILVIPKEESRELWAKRVRDQQRRIGSNQVATNTG